MTHKINHHRELFIFSIFFFLSFIIFTPSNAHAYFTTHQEARSLGNQTGLYLIEFKFGSPEHQVHMPIMAQNTTATNSTMVSYEILNEDDDVVTTGTAMGIVLSNASLDSDGTMYVTPKGFLKTFTLAVFFTPEKSDANKKYRLQVTYLPFNFDGTQQLKLNPSELQYYKTKLISL